MGGRENHCRGEGFLWKVCWYVIWTCLLGLFTSRALAETLVKGRTMQSCWCCCHSHPLCILWEKKSFSWVILSCCSQEGSCTCLHLRCAVQHVLHPLTAPAAHVSIQGITSPRVLVLLYVYFQNLVLSKWVVWWHLMLLEDPGEGLGRGMIRSSGLAVWWQPRARMQDLGCSLGGHIILGALVSLPLLPWAITCLTNLHPTYFSHCLLISKCNAWSDKVETALNWDGEDWRAQTIYCPVHHSSVWLQTYAHVHTS